MEKTEYQKWLDGRLIDYPTLGELAWNAALQAVQDRIEDHTITRADVLNIINGLSK